MIDPILMIVALASAPAPEGAVPPPAQREHESMPTEVSARPYIQSSLGGGMAWHHRVGGTFGGFGLTFGVGAGATLPDRGRLRIAVGGEYLHTGWASPGNGWPRNSIAELLAKVRVGARAGRVWGYGIGGLGVALGTEDGGDYFAVDAGPVATLGAGLRIPFRNGASLGFEAEGTVVYPPPDSVQARVSGSVIFAWRFGDRARPVTARRSRRTIIRPKG